MPAFDRNLIPAEPDLSFERALWKAGLTRVAGIDEAGRGALAGPVATAAVILPPDEELAGWMRGVRDSKQLSAAQREAARGVIVQFAVCWGVGFASAWEIDRMGILPATRLAAGRALQKLAQAPMHILLDYLFLPEVEIPQTALVKGDCRSLSIAAASILAKTDRDAQMRQLDLLYPGYGFSEHKGYGTLQHRSALLQLGVCPEHRLSFALYSQDDLPGDTSDVEI